MSALFRSRPQAVTLNIRERASSALTPVNLHWTGVALLAAINLYLVAQLVVTGQRAAHGNADAIARQQVALKTAEIAAQPLAGLDTKIARASTEAERFTDDRLPLNYSEVATEIGALARRTGTRITRIQYAQQAVAGAPALSAGNPDGQLTEVRMDASLSGDYRAQVLFLNALERDRTFFLISGVTLTGQQTGLVNLRIRIVTYLRGLGSVEEAQRATGGTGADAALDEAVPQAHTQIPFKGGPQ